MALLLAFGPWLGDGHAIAQPCVPVLDASPTIRLAEQAPRSFALADFDGDGALDVVMTRDASASHPYGIVVRLGNGDGTFQAALPVGPAEGGYLVVAPDLDADGSPDLIVSLVNKLSTYLGRGDGTFLAREENWLAMPINALETTDLDADGAPDIVTLNADGTVTTFLGDGSGGLGIVQTYLASQGFQVLAADVDGDGNVDVVTPDDWNHVVAVLPGNGDGSLRTATRVAVPEASSFDVADVNGDGWSDLAIGERETWILPGDGAGGFMPPIQITTGMQVDGIAFAELDGDGNVDIMAFGDDVTTLPGVVVLRGDGTGGFAPGRRSFVSEPRAVRAGDVDGDGMGDVVVAKGYWSDTNPLVVLLSRSPEELTSSTSMGAGCARMASDLNGDGWLDLVGQCGSGNWIGSQMNLGDGLFDNPVTTSLPSTVRGVAVTDLDGDAVPDAMAAIDGASGRVAILAGVGDGSFSAPAFHVVGDTPVAVSPGSMNADAILDVVSFEDSSVSVLLGIAGGYQAAVTTSGDPDTIGGGVGDFDGDGRMDVAIASDYPPAISVRLGNGDGTFQASLRHPQARRMLAIVVGLFDADALADVAVATENDTVEVLLSNGDGTLRLGSSEPVGARPALLGVCDWNGDGLLDLLTGNQESNDVSLLVGLGDGSFQPELAFESGGSSATPVAADFNRDGVVDLLVDGDSLLIGLSGSLAVRPVLLDPGFEGAPYAVPLTATGGTPPYTFVARTGAMPPGLSLQATGQLAGTPTDAGSYTFGVSVRDASGCSSARIYDLEIVDHAVIVAGQGAAAANPSRVRTFSRSGASTAVDFFAYGGSAWGTNVAAGDVDGSYTKDEILTGPGPGPVLGPHVRGFDRDGTSVPGLSFYAYGTLRFGVNVAAAALDGMPHEIVSGAGAGAVFGPHVRGWAYTGTAVVPVSGFSYFAYATLKYGVNVAGGQIDPDSFDEVATGAGHGVVFGSHVRGWNHDGQSVASIAAISFMAFPYAGYGASVSVGDFGGSRDIAAAPGPGPTHPAHVRAFHYDGTSITPLTGVNVIPFPSRLGCRLGTAVDDTSLSRGDMAIGSGPDPAAPSAVKVYDASGGRLWLLDPTFAPFPGEYGGVNVAGGMLTP